ncbi:urate hydroxylase PuuD [Rhodospirillaceae bacterium SYSU D60014]|uniref:urate hydroxylase PuuD n=1 Tax=Virgifigura deserti TaxID=2268457 RepID=UPI000E672E95
MKNPLESLHATLVIGLLGAVILLLILHTGVVDEAGYYQFLFRWFHVLAGVLWVGLLYYFNFVQMPSMPKIPDDQKPAIGKVIGPAALFWFRWAAAATVLFGLITAHLNGYLVEALTFQQGVATIGIGMWLALIMAFNVWFVIWPNQKRALGLVEADAEAKKRSARQAMLFSRANTLLSIPMLYCMVAQQQGLA